ncbi:MAG: class B sortase [Eubacteriales bacterium]|nr:class B sortase [Eubacteriales bacterium]
MSDSENKDDELINDFLDSDYNTEDDEDAEAVFDAKEKRRKKNTILRRLVMIIAAGVFIFAAGNLISIFHEYNKGNQIYNSIEKEVLDEDAHTKVIIGDEDNEVDIPFTYDHNTLLSINKDGLGYVYIPSIDCRLPLVQASDNDYYLSHTFDNVYNINGCLFEDYRINGGLSASHVIIHGHNMKSGAMFGKLSRYKSYNFWNTQGNSSFYIYTGNVIKEYKIFSCHISEPVGDTYTYNFPSLESMRAYASEMKSRSLYDTGIDVSNATQIVTLSTCTDDLQNRLIVHGIYTGEATLP